MAIVSVSKSLTGSGLITLIRVATTNESETEDDLILRLLSRSKHQPRQAGDTGDEYG